MHLFLEHLYKKEKNQQFNKIQPDITKFPDTNDPAIRSDYKKMPDNIGYRILSEYPVHP